jgi:hypothetical protein
MFCPSLLGVGGGEATAGREAAARIEAAARQFAGRASERSRKRHTAITIRGREQR